jgi:dolichyl-phosphate beta-glucosyltransferase
MGYFKNDCKGMIRCKNLKQRFPSLFGSYIKENMNFELSIIIATYNNKSLTVEKTAALDKFLSGLNVSYEIILVDDGSVPGEKVSEESLPKTVKLLFNKSNMGKGYSIKKGMLAAKGNVRIFTDIDLPYELSAIPYMYKLISTGYFDFVAGDRTHVQSVIETKTPFIRKLTSLALSKLVNLIFTGGVMDTQCGLKGFSGALAQKLFPLLTIDKFSFDVEIFYLLLKYDVSIKRIPVRLGNGTDSSVKPVFDGFRAIFDVFSIPLKWYLGCYHSDAMLKLNCTPY